MIHQATTYFSLKYTQRESTLVKKARPLPLHFRHKLSPTMGRLHCQQVGAECWLRHLHIPCIIHSLPTLSSEFRCGHAVRQCPKQGHHRLRRGVQREEDGRHDVVAGGQGDAMGQRCLDRQLREDEVRRPGHQHGDWSFMEYV